MASSGSPYRIVVNNLPSVPQWVIVNSSIGKRNSDGTWNTRNFNSEEEYIDKINYEENAKSMTIDCTIYSDYLEPVIDADLYIIL